MGAGSVSLSGSDVAVSPPMKNAWVMNSIVMIRMVTLVLMGLSSRIWPLRQPRMVLAGNNGMAEGLYSGHIGRGVEGRSGGQREERIECVINA